MTTRTREQLATAVLRKLGVIDAIETPSAADQQYVISEYDDKHAELEDQRRAYWPANEIPLAVFQIMVRMIANEVGATYGDGSRVEDRETRFQIIQKQLIRHVARPASGVPTRAKHF